MSHTNIQSFIDVSTIHQAEISYCWVDDKVHDSDYHFKVWDSMDAKVKELEKKYDISDDTRYCCQWEGKLICGDDRAKVEAAAKELARHLAKFKGIRPLPHNVVD